MDKTGLKNEEQLQRIRVSGSLALTNVNEQGYHRFKDYDPYDGIISGKLKRPKYNIDELQKSIDTTISELIPLEEKQEEPMVLKEIYDNALDIIDGLQVEVENLNNIILELRERISELELANINLSDGVNARIAQLEAIIAALTMERDSLREQLFGRMGRQQEGDIVGTDFSIRIVNVNEKDVKGLIHYYDIRRSGRDDVWINGNKVEIINFSGSGIEVRVQIPDTVIHSRFLGTTIRANDVLRLSDSSITKLITVGDDERKEVEFMITPDYQFLPPVDVSRLINRREVYQFSIRFTSVNSGSVVELPVILRKERVI